MENAENQVKKSFFKSWKTLKLRSKFYQIFVHLFALAGLAIIGAWGFYQLGFTNDKGGVDENNRYLADYKNNLVKTDSSKIFENQMHNYLNLVALSKFYPLNAHLMIDAARYSDRQDGMDQMIYAANMYLMEEESGTQYRQLLKELNAVLDKYPTARDTANLVPWMNEGAWPSLKAAILKDRAVIEEAARLTGVEPRLIVGCLVGEQIRLFNSKREMYKQYLGPVKVLSVQSQFSFGVNGIKDFTAQQVERNLKDTASIFYMGKAYEHILDFNTADHATERYQRLTGLPTTTITSTPTSTRDVSCGRRCCSGNGRDMTSPTDLTFFSRFSTWDSGLPSPATTLNAAAPISRPMAGFTPSDVSATISISRVSWPRSSLSSPNPL